MSRLPPLLAAVSALVGALAVALAAAGAHLPQGGEFTRTAAVFLLLHAATGLGIASHARIAYHANALILFGFLLLAGAAMFAADLAFHDFFGRRMFPFAAPVGGTTMIAMWAALAIAFAIEAGRVRR
jgi:uncharacterized membrane protein YgdD (TMEM256/DUF423 family)